MGANNKIKRMSIDIQFTGERGLKEAFEKIVIKVRRKETNVSQEVGDFYKYKYLLSTQEEQNEKRVVFKEIEPRIEIIKGETHYIFPSKANEI